MGDEEGAENQFQCLTDDVVLNIFDKVSDIKWLCRSFVVSKRFASLIPRVQTVSINSSIWNSNWLSCSDSSNEKENPQGLSFLGNFSKFVDNLVFEPLRFLQLKQIQSLSLEIVSDFNGDHDSVFKWGAKFTSELDSVTFLYAESLSEMRKSEAEQDEEAEPENEITLEELIRRVGLAVKCVKYASWWQAVLSHVFAEYPLLQIISITDWNNKGVKLCLAGEKLVECRNTFNMRPMIFSERAYSRIPEITGGHLPVLLLPISGHVMKGVTIVNFKTSDHDFEANTTMLDSFAEEQGVFLEGVVQILEKHKDCINALF